MSNVTVTDSSCLRMDSRVPLVPLILFLQSYLQLLRECRGKLFVIMTSIVRLSSNSSYGQVKVKMKTVCKPIVAHQAGAFPGFRMKRLRVFLLPPGWDAGPSQGYPYLVGFCFVLSNKLKF